MHALGNHILRGRSQAIIIITAFTLCSVILFPLAYLLSGAPLALVTLGQGSRQGLQVIIGVGLVLTLFSLAVQWPVHLVLAYSIFIWIPVWLCATILRLSQQQGILVTAAGLMGMVTLATLYVTLSDTGGWWQNLLNNVIEKNLPIEQQAEYKDRLLPMAEFISALLVVGFVVNLVTTVMLSRWWQALLYNPGGFGKEFRALRLPPVILMLTAANIIACLVVAEPWSRFARDTLAVIVFMFLFQGLALAHRTVDARRLPDFWLVITYGLLLLVPGLALFMACLGMIDSWHASRKPIRPNHD